MNLEEIKYIVFGVLAFLVVLVIVLLIYNISKSLKRTERKQLLPSFEEIDNKKNDLKNTKTFSSDFDINKHKIEDAEDDLSLLNVVDKEVDWTIIEDAYNENISTIKAKKKRIVLPKQEKQKEKEFTNNQVDEFEDLLGDLFDEENTIRKD